MSVLSRVAAPSATSELAGVVAALFGTPERAAPKHLFAPPAELDPVGADGDGARAHLLHAGPSGLGTSAARPAARTAVLEPGPTATRPPVSRPSFGPNGIGTSAARRPAAAPAEAPDLELFCPPPVRDNVELGEEVDGRLIEWAEEVGVYPGQLDKLRSASFGRLVMLTHPATDDADRLLAAGKCIVAEWATDDHFLDDESLGADAAVIGSRLATTYPAVDPADLPLRYVPDLEDALAGEPVAVAYRSAFEHLARYASATQLARLRHELAVMFMAYNQEATWRTTGRVPPVWEYLVHRHENSFLPPMVLVDPIAGYEVPAPEFADRRVRRAFCLAGTASVVLNDLYSKGKETDSDFDLPKVIAAEEHCSAGEAIERTVEIHNELMHTYVAEASLLSSVGSPALRRFLADIWAWLGGNREWHSTTERYHPPTTQ
jgi:2-methylisoborneol synthase